MSNRRYRNIYIDGCSHFCTASIVEYLQLLNNDRSRQVILDSWNRQRLRWNVLIEGFVIMPEHIHILVRGSADSVKKFMQYSLAETSHEISRLINIQSKTDNIEAEKWLAVEKIELMAMLCTKSGKKDSDAFHWIKNRPY